MSKDRVRIETPKGSLEIWRPNIEELLKGGSPMETFNKVKSFRVGAKISQEEMAKALGLSRSAYILKENGNADWKLSEMNKFVEIVNENTGSTYSAAEIFF